MPALLKTLAARASTLAYGPWFFRQVTKNQPPLCHAVRHFTSSGGVGDPENKGGQQRGVNFDTLGSWNNRMELPINLEQSIKAGKVVPHISIDKAAHASLLGRRNANEDRCLISSLDGNILLFAIFDGHGGALAADYARTNLEVHLKYWLQREKKDLSKVLFESFVELNNAFSRHLFFNYAGDDQALASGTTATVALLRNSMELAIGHVGDSSAIMCRAGQALRLSQNHEPDVVEEKERIKRCGGTIIYNSVGRPRVNGRLDMTRSIGDVEMKPFGVIAEPFVRTIGVKHGRDAFLILTTDGISFVMSDQEIIDIVSTCEYPEEAAQLITDQALQYGSEDNCTAIVIPFGAWGKYSRSPNSVPYSFGRNIIGNRYR